MANEFSPEEKLLHLIKGKQKPVVDDKLKAEELPPQAIPLEVKQPEPAPYKASGADDKARAGGSVAQSINVPDSIERANKTVQGSKTIFNTHYLILGAFIILVCLAGYFIFSGLIGKEDKEVENLKLLIKSFSDTKEPGEVKADRPLAAVKIPPSDKKPASSFEDYQKLLNEKAIFAPPVKSNNKAREVDGPSLRDLVKDLSLVGIIPGDSPQAIIEDKKNGQTLFLKRGEMIDNIRVKEILSGKAILEYNDETITLSL